MMRKEKKKMKKNYNKPQIFYENFGISSSIAACATGVAATEDTCGYTVAGRTLFTANNTGCEYVTQDGEFGVCFYIPSSETNLFAS